MDFSSIDAKMGLLQSGSANNEEDDLTLPRASLNKIIKEALPNLRVQNEVKDIVLNCCTEFIHLISSEANEICNTQQKKTMNADHILQALDKLGFGSFRAESEEVAKACKTKRRRQSTRLENLGIPEEELYRQQQELFAKAREEVTVQDSVSWQEIQLATMTRLDDDDDDDEYF